MEFRIADTFTGSLARLTGDEQQNRSRRPHLTYNSTPPVRGCVSTSSTRCGTRTSGPFGSTATSSIVHRTSASPPPVLRRSPRQGLCLGGAPQARTHPTTGAAHAVEIREMVKEIIVPVYVQPAIAGAAAGVDASVRRHVRSSIVGIRRACRMARRRQDGDQCIASAAHRASPRRSGRGAFGTCDRRKAPGPHAGGNNRGAHCPDGRPDRASGSRAAA